MEVILKIHTSSLICFSIDNICFKKIRIQKYYLDLIIYKLLSQSLLKEKMSSQTTIQNEKLTKTAQFSIKDSFYNLVASKFRDDQDESEKINKKRSVKQKISDCIILLENIYQQQYEQSQAEDYMQSNFQYNKPLAILFFQNCKQYLQKDWLCQKKKFKAWLLTIQQHTEREYYFSSKKMQEKLEKQNRVVIKKKSKKSQQKDIKLSSKRKSKKKVLTKDQKFQKYIIMKVSQCEILQQIQNYWFQIVHKKYNEVSIQQFFLQYHKFRVFYGQVIYTFFECYLEFVEPIIRQTFLKIRNSVAPKIITNKPSWKILFQLIVEPGLSKIYKDQYGKREKQRPLQKFIIEELQIPNYAVQIYPIETNNLQKTTNSINQFLNENRIQEKSKLLISIRETLQQQILNHQKELIQKEIIAKYQIIQVDTFISCFIYSIIKGNVSLCSLWVHLKFIRFLLSKYRNFSYIFDSKQIDIDNKLWQCEDYGILSKCGNERYLVDLQVVVEYLLEWMQQGRKSQQLVKRFSKKLSQTNSKVICDSTEKTVELQNSSSDQSELQQQEDVELINYQVRKNFSKDKVEKI